jgi:hypothetical protein
MRSVALFGHLYADEWHNLGKAVLPNDGGGIAH